MKRNPPTTWQPAVRLNPTAAGIEALLREGYSTAQVEQFRKMRNIFEYAASKQHEFNRSA